MYNGWIVELTHWATIKLSSEKMAIRIIKWIINWPMVFTPHVELAMRCYEDAKNSKNPIRFNWKKQYIIRHFLEGYKRRVYQQRKDFTVSNIE